MMMMMVRCVRCQPLFQLPMYIQSGTPHDSEQTTTVGSDQQQFDEEPWRLRVADRWTIVSSL